MVCLEQNISIGSIHASLHNFHNVSMYVKWPQKLVMLDVKSNTAVTEDPLDWVSMVIWTMIVDVGWKRWTVGKWWILLSEVDVWIDFMLSLWVDSHFI